MAEFYNNSFLIIIFHSVDVENDYHCSDFDAKIFSNVENGAVDDDRDCGAGKAENRKLQLNILFTSLLFLHCNKTWTDHILIKLVLLITFIYRGRRCL